MAELQAAGLAETWLWNNSPRLLATIAESEERGARSRDQNWEPLSRRGQLWASPRGLRATLRLLRDALRVS
jgi:hypothetical protein